MLQTDYSHTLGKMFFGIVLEKSDQAANYHKEPPDTHLGDSISQEHLELVA